MKAKKAAIYCRTSTAETAGVPLKCGTFEPEEERDAVAYQIGSAMSYIIDKNLELTGVYTDIGNNSPEVWATIARDKQKFDMVVVRDLGVVMPDDEMFSFFSERIPVLFVGAEDWCYTKEDFDPDTLEIGKTNKKSDEHKEKLSQSVASSIQSQQAQGIFHGRIPYGYQSSCYMSREAMFSNPL